MAVKIRLKRIGAKKAPVYRVVVMDSRQPRDGRVIDLIGRYNPRTNPITLELDKTKAQKWLDNGAVPTEIVNRLFGYAELLKPTTKKLKKKSDSKADKTETKQEPTKEVATEEVKEA